MLARKQLAKLCVPAVVSHSFAAELLLAINTALSTHSNLRSVFDEASLLVHEQQLVHLGHQPLRLHSTTRTHAPSKSLGSHESFET
jgi:hypothetical protein